MAADDAAIADLTKQLVRLSDALARSEERAKKSAEATKEAAAAKKADAAEAAKLSSQLAKLARDITGVEKATEHHGAIVNTLSTALKSLARDGVGAATGALVEWARQIPEGAARAEAHQRALDQLGSAYGAVERATNGAVTAEQAAQVQQRAMQSGLRLSAQELAAVTQRARDYARATGTELGQALDQLTDQLVDPGEELRKFGVFLQTGMSAGDALRETLRQITAQAGQTAPAVQSLAEAQEDFHRATQEASDALSAQVAQELGLRDFYTSLASWIRDATTAASTFDHVVDGVVGTLREMVGLQSSVSLQQNQSASGAFVQRAGGLAAAARARGVNLGGLQLGEVATVTNADEQRQIESLLRTLGDRGPQRAADPLFAGGGGAFRGVGGFELAEIERIAQGARARHAQEQARATAERARAERDRASELSRRNNASTSSIGTRPAAGPSRLERLMDAAAGSGGIGGGGGFQDILDGFERDAELMREGQQKAKRSGFMSLDDRREALGQWRQGQDVSGGDAVRTLTEQQRALRELADEAVRAEEAARASGADVNDLMRQRIGIQQALVQTTRELTDATREQTAWMEPWTSAMEGAGNTLAEGFGQSIMDAIEGTRSFEDAMGAMLRATVQSIAKQAIVETVKNTAMGFGHLASGNVPSSLAAFKSAGLWAATAVVAGGITAATAPSSSAAASAPARVDGGERTSAARADRDRGAGGPLVLNIAVSGAAFTDAGVHQAVAGALRGAVGSGYLTPTDLRGLLDG